MSADYIRDPKGIELLFKFTKSLCDKNEGTWKDEYGSTWICMGRNRLVNLVQKYEIDKLRFTAVVSPVVENRLKILSRLRINSCLRSNASCVISIGGAREHNIARESLSKIRHNGRIQHVCVPVPLTNDSFCTNRSTPCYGIVDTPSRATLYPSQIIIDFDLLELVPIASNIVGVGEVVGSYYSVKDYFATKQLPPPEGLISNIEKSISHLMSSINVREMKASWLSLLAIALIQKCLIMRLARSNEIGAGADHLIAYALDQQRTSGRRGNRPKLPHGKLVYLGAIAVAALYPEWEYGFFSLGNLVNIGKEVQIIDRESLGDLANLLESGLPQLAIHTRPNRSSVIKNLSSERITTTLTKINRILEVF